MKIKLLMAVAIIAVSGITLSAQPNTSLNGSDKPQEIRRERNAENFPSPLKLTDEQRQEMQKIRMERMKERTQIQNQIKEKKARLEVLQTADKADMKEINKTIDEITALQAKNMKADAADRQNIRNLLTEEQRIIFDAQGGGKGMMHGHGPDRKQFDRKNDSPRQSMHAGPMARPRQDRNMEKQ
ncbi:MAG: periplasmic heavy metal sensor [Bacteroidales bacterium]|jgi:Spy/CpxP family protein refolding chaperone|nr:periplasmic heavy metal sensor [Bacteroidales bacterium]